ncbi:MAG: hypothetical protein Q7K03_07945 [Dehalococcoidia bacterium]|nr:hypothetical protein [Dehalococcoidia bacterium]
MAARPGNTADIDLDENTSVAIGKDGLPVISYTDDPAMAVKVVHCTSADCTTHGSVITVDQGAVGTATSMIIGADGLPAVVYTIRSINNSQASVNIVHFNTVDMATP